MISLSKFQLVERKYLCYVQSLSTEFLKQSRSSGEEYKIRVLMPLIFYISASLRTQVTLQNRTIVCRNLVYLYGLTSEIYLLIILSTRHNPFTYVFSSKLALGCQFQSITDLLCHLEHIWGYFNQIDLYVGPEYHGKKWLPNCCTHVYHYPHLCF